MPLKEIKEGAKVLKITDRQLQYARESLNIKFTSKGSQGSIWYL